MPVAHRATLDQFERLLENYLANWLAGSSRTVRMTA
jgi:hypothetical protein